MLVLSRRLDGRTSRLLPIVAGTVFSQTLINLLALAILLGGDVHERAAAAAATWRGSRSPSLCRWRCACWSSSGRACWRSAGARARRAWRVAADAIGADAAARPAAAWSCSPARATASRPSPASCWRGRCSGWPATWSCSRSGCKSQAGLAAAAAILLAVNLSAILPATPSNVGVFQAACLVVLAAYGVGAGHGPRLRHHPAGGRGRSPRSRWACRRCSRRACPGGTSGAAMTPTSAGERAQ